MVFGWSKKEKIREEITKVERILSDLSYTINYINSELSRNPKSETEVRAIGNGMLVIVDRIVGLKWSLFTVKNIKDAGFDIDEVNGVDELHNNTVYQKEKGYLATLQKMKTAINLVITNLILTGEQLRRPQQDTAQYAQAQGKYMSVISALKATLTSLIEDLTGALQGENSLLCGIRYYNQVTRIIRLKRPRWKSWAARAALVNTLMGTAAFNPAVRQQAVVAARAPIQTLKIGMFSFINLEGLQEKVNEINLKIKKRQAVSEEEVDFLRALYQLIATGGSFKGLPEAGRLMDQYINGGGADLEVNPNVYTNCPAVQEAMRKMSDYVLSGIRAGRLPTNGSLRSFDKDVRKFLGGRSSDTDYQNSGIMSNGYMKAGVADSRDLFYSDRRFGVWLDYSTNENGGVTFDWSVRSVYDFRDKGEKSTFIPMPGGRLRLWDRISCAIATTAEGNRSFAPFGSEFRHTARWTTYKRLGQTVFAQAN